jgi:hypothetical protein
MVIFTQSFLSLAAGFLPLFCLRIPLLNPLSPVESVVVRTPRFAVLYRFFQRRKPFKMNTSMEYPQVFILKELQEVLSCLESTLTRKGGGGGVSVNRQVKYKYKSRKVKHPPAY